MGIELALDRLSKLVEVVATAGEGDRSLGLKVCMCRWCEVRVFESFTQLEVCFSLVIGWKKDRCALPMLLYTSVTDSMLLVLYSKSCRKKNKERTLDPIG